MWIACEQLGAVRFDLASRKVDAYPTDPAHPQEFEYFFIREWLPLLYQAWGCQVLHASAAVHLGSGRVAAFSAPAHGGKSTLGYALGQRPGWQQLADENVAMQVEHGQLQLVPIPAIVRLRPASAAHFGCQPGGYAYLPWPEGPLALTHVFFLAGMGAQDSPQFPQITPINGAQAYPLFLNQAFALTLQIPDHNKRLMSDYLQVARQVAACQLTFCKDFAHLEETIALVASYVQS